MTHAPFPPPPARQRRPSGWWFVAGGALVVSAIVAFAALFAWTLMGFLETDATLEADGQPHLVSVPTDQDRMLWADQTVSRPECQIVDTRTDELLELRPVSGTFTRSNGSSGDWTGVSRFDPGSGRLEVTCQGVHAGAVVEIGPTPALGSFVVGLLATILVPLALGGSGVVVLIVTGVLFATGRSRSDRPPADPSETF